MGMFDTFIGTAKCPKCGDTIQICTQTKNFDCKLKRLRVGDYVDTPDSNYYCEMSSYDKAYCPYCGEVDIYANIRNGQLISFVNEEEFDNEYKLETAINLIKSKIEECKELITKKQFSNQDECLMEVDKLINLLKESDIQVN